MAGTVGASLVLQGALLVSGVLTARLLGVEGRGYLVLLMLIPLALAPLVALGLPLAVVFEVSRAPAAARAIARTVFRPALVQMVGLVLLHALIVAIVLSDAPEDVSHAGTISLAVGPAILAQHYGIVLLQGQGHFRAFNVLRLLPFVLNGLAVGVVFAIGSNDLELLVIAWTVTYALAALLTLLAARRRLPPPSDGPLGPQLSPMLSFGAKGLLGSASPVETFRLDQAIVGLFLSPAALGLYAAGLAVTNLPRLVALGVGAVAYPAVAARPHPDAARRAMWRFFTLTFIAAALLVIGLEVIAAWLISFFFGPEFEAAIPVTRILLVGAPFLAARRVLTDASRGAGLPGMGSVGELASWAILVPAVAVGASLSGVRGVALALAGSAALSLVILVVAVLAGGRRAEPSVDAPPANFEAGATTAGPTGP